VIGGLFSGATTKELDLLSIQTTASFIADEPEYSKLAARLPDGFITKEGANPDIHSFSPSIATGKQHGLASKGLAAFITANARKLNDAIDGSRSELFEYFGQGHVLGFLIDGFEIVRRRIEQIAGRYLRTACPGIE
jgi:ribonucleoside-diphosphate reductase alpha chain